ncbi:MAG: tRNA (adenosine(37)-N6)-threonylcarbamoyltransferase complex dimerization subunit type 1 TsaB [Pirellulales bacterium]
MKLPTISSGAMRVLALETSGREGSIALLKGLAKGTHQLVDQVELADGQRTAESLLPAIGTLLDQAQWPPRSIQLVSVATGPGSFTGLRIGVTTAKTFAFATGAKLVGIHTLATLARAAQSSPDQSQPDHSLSNPQSDSGRLWAILNAQRQELFVAQFEQGCTDLQNPLTQIVSISTWLSQLQPGDTVVGPPMEKLSSQLPQGVKVLAKNLWRPNAIAVGQLGIELALNSHQVQPMQLVPQYYRQSAAEENRASH